MAVLLETTLGDITIDLLTEERPRCCLNFLKLCKIKYYNYCLIHTVQQNFLVQSGDPAGTVQGGESIFRRLYGDQANYFEAATTPKIKHRKIGTVSMVNNGSGGHGSQFFITTGENLDYLDGTHTVFGEVSEGHEVLMKINEAICDNENRPYQDIRINHTIILDDPFDDPPGLTIPDRSPEPTKDQLDSGRIGADEEIDDMQGKTTEEVDELIKEKEAKARAQVLEMVGDLPEADMAPPENVLFVCKLNPVTTDEDLEIIFSRFGVIKSCEVIRDQKTGDSLQYAFIEFEKPEDCESAYFKMDNVLIDDRRIHVDFSQSVSKVNWKGKGTSTGYFNKPDQSERPQFVVKGSQRKDDRYSMVFDGDDSDSDKHRSHRSRTKHYRRDDRYEKKRTKEQESDSRNKQHSSHSSSDRLSESKHDTHRHSKPNTERHDKRTSSPSDDSKKYHRRNYSSSPDDAVSKTSKKRGYVKESASLRNFREKESKYHSLSRNEDRGSSRKYNTDSRKVNMQNESDSESDNDRSRHRDHTSHRDSKSHDKRIESSKRKLRDSSSDSEHDRHERKYQDYNRKKEMSGSSRYRDDYKGDRKRR